MAACRWLRTSWSILPWGESASGAIVDASTGSVEGSYTASGTPAFSGTTGYFLQGQNAALSAKSSSNAVLWSFSGDGSLATSPIVVNQTVIIGSSSGNVHALDGLTGQQVWTANAGAAIPSVGDLPTSGLAAGDGLLIVPAGNQVVAYTLSTNPWHHPRIPASSRRSAGPHAFTRVRRSSVGAEAGISAAVKDDVVPLTLQRDTR